MGLFNAFLVQFIAIPAIVATLATLSMYRGLSQALSDGEQVTGLPAENSFFTFVGGDFAGLPVSVWVLIIVAAGLTAVLRFTPYGYRVRSIGSNPEAATFSGISIPRVRVQTLVLVGLLCGLSGMLGLAFFIARRSRTSAAGFELTAIAAAVIGGTPLRGGSATVVGAVLGVDPAERRQQRPRLLQRAGQLELVRHGRRDPHRGRARQPDPRPPPAPTRRPGPVIHRLRGEWHDDGEWLVALVAALASRGAARRTRAPANDDRPASGSSAAARRTAKLAFVYPTTTTNFAQEMALGAKAAADDTPGVDAHRVRAAEVNGPKQVQLFQAATRTLQGRRGDDDAHARPVHPPAADRARRRTCRWSRSTCRRPRAPRTP